MATLNIKDGAGAPKKIRTNEPVTDEHVPHHHIVDTSGTVLGVSGAALHVQGTVTATGPLTDAQLRATAVPVSGTVTASGPLTDTQLRATAVPVSGPLTDTQLRATAVPVSGTVAVTGVATAANQATTNTNLGATTDAEASGDGTLIAILKRIRTVLGGLLSVTPQMSSAGHQAITTAATGTNWTAFTSQACKQALLSNQTGVSISVRQGGSGSAITIPTGALVPFYGLTNLSQLEVQRLDNSNTQVTLAARWES